MWHCEYCGHHHRTRENTPRCGAFTEDETGFHKCGCTGEPRENQEAA
jgi:hypothetical protein